MGGSVVRVELEGAEELRRKLLKLAEAAKDVLEESVMAGAEIIQAEANRTAPGPHVAIAIEKETPLRVKAKIGPDQAHWYYQFFETGVQPHEIKAKRKAALAFPYQGRGEEGTVTKRVSHPGMAARPFLRPAFDAKKGEAEDAVGDELRAALLKVAR